MGTSTSVGETKNRDRKEWSQESICKKLPSLYTSDELKKSVDNCRPICQRCPVLSECLGYALAHPDITGIWAGTNSSQRAKIRTKINRQILEETVPLEPSLQDYVKGIQESAPVVVEKPKEIQFPKKPARIVSKPPRVEIPQQAPEPKPVEIPFALRFPNFDLDAFLHMSPTAS